MTSLGAVHGIVFASLSVVATSMHVQHKPALSLPRISLRVDGPGDDAPRSSDDAEACGLLARELGASVLLPTLQRTAATVLSRVLADDAMRVQVCQGGECVVEHAADGHLVGKRARCPLA